jgi:tetratricopeptide (TPR) repeat protein
MIENKNIESLRYFKQSALMDASPITYYRISNCYENMGDFEAALSNIDQAIKLDSTDYTYIQEKADLLYEASRSKEAIALYDQFINNDPEYFGGYYRRGFMKDNTNDTEGAIEDYSTVIMLKPDYAYAYLGRGDMYEKLGKHELAEKDYYKVIELDTVPEDNSCAQYAFFALGELDKAKSYMNRLLKRIQKMVETIMMLHVSIVEWVKRNSRYHT